MTHVRLTLVFGLALTLAACSTRRETTPPRTATEQLLISAAADRAADRLNIDLPEHSKVFVDSSNIEGLDSKYAIATMRAGLLRRGGALVADRAAADVIVEIRSGALSMDESKFLLGVPEFQIPVPASGAITFPEIALFKKAERKGVAKFAGVGYDAKDGHLLGASDPQFGFSHETRYVLLLFFSWERKDFIPQDEGLIPLGAEDLPRLPGRSPEPPP
jgi:hypothetical protein